MRTIIAVLLATAALLAACGDDDDGGGVDVGSTTPTTSSMQTQTGSASPAPTDVPGKTAAPTDSPGETDPPGETEPPASDVGLLTPVDKQHSLPASYVPPDLAPLGDGYLAPGFSGSLRQEALDALVQMLDAAYEEGHDIRSRSAYRSYSEQEATFNYWVSVLGYDEATRVSAMPGHSEHQLGTAADLSSPDVGWDLAESFGATAAGQWLDAHAHEYGYVLSYPEDGEPVTGYSYEPWHWRYIGIAEAAAFEASGLYLNQYLTQ
jgi:D-alanyl-D-alanine carboxypeptidase